MDEPSMEPPSSNSVATSLSSPNSLASTSTGTTLKGQSRKRQRTSWTEQHIIIIMENGVSRRRCSHCSILWSSSTSTGTIAKHLLDKHHINSTSQPFGPSAVMQPPVDASKLLLSRAVEKKMDIVVAQYLVTEMLPHVHVESAGFKTLMQNVLPGYKLKSSRTVKRSILQMYVVLRQLVCSYLSKQDSRFAVTYDGWSNSSMKGFYPVTLHWVCLESAKPKSMLLDFFNVFPGDGVGKRCAQALFARLKSFGLSSRLLCIISDGASDAQVASQELARLLRECHGIDILPSSHILKCMVHTFQLGVKSALEVISPSSMKLRNNLVSIRSSKVRRAVFRKYSRSMYEHGEREPPCIDVITRWNSTLVMYQQAIKLRAVLNCTITDSAIAVDFSDSVLTLEDWNHIQAMEQWLDVPARICNYLSGSKYPTLSIAALAFNGLLAHCNKYLGMNVESMESSSTKATLQVQQEASHKCLQYLIKYQESLKSVPSRIGMFLDPRLPTHINSIERNLDIQLVRNTLEANYYIHVDVSSTIGADSQRSETEKADFWEMLGVNIVNTNESTSSNSEIDHYMNFPRAKTDVDPLQWWLLNRFSLPSMYKMACDYLAIPASSVPSEEANSEARYNFEGRIRLHECTFKAEMCTRSWLELLEEANVLLPDDFNEAYQNLNIDLEDIAMEDDVVDYMLKEKTESLDDS